MSLFGQKHGFSDVDGAGAGEQAAAYLEAAALEFRDRRLTTLDLLDLRPGSAVLDAGCGLGEILIEAAKRVMPGGTAIGCDLSQEMVDRARAGAAAQGSAAGFEVGDVTALRFEADTFDAVRCERVLQHLDDGAATAAVAELVRVAKPRGRVCITDAVHSQHVVDCEDIELFQMALSHFLGLIRDPYAGIRLARRLSSAGATVVSFDVLTALFPFAMWRQAIAIEESLQALVSAGEVTGARAESFLNDLAERDAAGVFHAVGVGYRALAIKDGKVGS